MPEGRPTVSILHVILIPRERSSLRRAGLKRGLLAALLAVGGHGLFLALILFLSLLHLALPPLKRLQTKSQVVLRGVSADQWAQNRGDKLEQNNDDRQQRAQRERKKDEKKPDKAEEPKGQVVATPPGNNQVDPNAKYVSE